MTKDLGKIKFKDGKYEEAMPYFQQALEILKDTTYERGELITKVSIAATYNQMGIENPQYYDSALTYLLP